MRLRTSPPVRRPAAPLATGSGGLRLVRLDLLQDLALAVLLDRPLEGADPDRRAAYPAHDDLAAHLVDHVVGAGLLDLFERRALILLRDHRGAGLADGAALPLEAHLLRDAVLDGDIHRDHVAAA